MMSTRVSHVARLGALAAVVLCHTAAAASLRATAAETAATSEAVAAQGADPCGYASRNSQSCSVITVTTSDSLDLALLYLPASRSAAKKGVAYLQHGLMDSSDTWLLNGRKSSLALTLTAQGYDVYLGNSRGNQYSDGGDYDWSFDQMAEYDLPATIAAVKSHSGASSILYIGHSQGTAILFAGLISGWVRSSDIALFVALAPPLRLQHQQSLLFGTLGLLGGDTALKLLGNKAFLPTLSIVNKLLNTDFTDQYDLLKAIFGPSNNLGGSNWQGNFPAPTSAQNVGHWIQEARSGDFCKYKPHFWSLEQEYDLNDYPSSVPTMIYAGSNDYLADPGDISDLLGTLRGVGGSALTYYRTMQGYAHMDFTWALGAQSDLYTDVVDKCNVYSNKTLA